MIETRSTGQQQPLLQQSTRHKFRHPSCKMVKMIETLAEFEELVAGDKPVVIDFTATWCGPCQRIGPKFAEMEGEFTNISMVKVDVDANEEAAAKCGISAMPTFQVWKGGEKVDELVGAAEDKLRALCTKYN
jgi:thioredoxin 1